MMMMKPVGSAAGLAKGAVRTSWLVTLGAISITQRETSEALDKLVERGEAVDRQGRKRVRRILRRSQEVASDMGDALETGVGLAANDLGLVTHDTMRHMEFRVDQVGEKLDDALETAKQESKRREAERKAAQRQVAERKAQERQDAESNGNGEAEAANLPIRGYAQMRVPEILDELPRLNEEGLERVRRYEEAHAAHKSVLEAIDRELEKRQPLPGYREMSAAEIAEAVRELDVDQVLALREYESQRGDRVTIMRAVERRLKELIGLPDYPNLTVAQLGEWLTDLSDEDLDKLRAFEESHGNRQGALRAIDRVVAGRMPLPDYGEWTVDEVVERLDGLDAEKLQQLREYEQSHRNRMGVMEAVERRLKALEDEGRAEEQQA